MANVTAKLPDDIMTRFSSLGNRTDEICEKMLQAGGQVVLERAKSNLSAVVGKGTKNPSRSTGQLEKALGVSKPRLNKNGNLDVKIGFAENRHDGLRNGMLAAILEYGKHGQPPKPFMKPAQRQSKDEAVDAMKTVFEREVGKA